MRIWRTIAFVGVPAVLAAVPASAASLSVVTVAAPAINCVFETDCTITVTDSIGNIPLPALVSGAARLQTRTFTGKPGTPAAGKTGYEYRVDLTTAVTNIDFSCVTDLAVDFGPITKLQYNNVGPVDDVYVVTKGGLGKIGLLSADQSGGLVTFTFSQPVCAGSSPNTGDTTFFFGLASAFAPHVITAKVGIPGDLPRDVAARAPEYPHRLPPAIALERPGDQAQQAEPAAEKPPEPSQNK